MSMRIMNSLTSGLIAAALFSSCTSSTPSTPPNAQNVVTLVSNGVRTAGTAMLSTTTAISSLTSPCDVHGYPNGLNQSDANYPGYLAHCFMSVDAGDTVLGGMTLAKNITCLMNAAGITYDGIPHLVTVTETMMTNCGMSPSGLMKDASATVTGSSPASFNSNYSHGIVIDLSASTGLVFKVASNLFGTINEFITNESWSDGSIGTTAGTFDSNTGDLWYESRVERNNCTTFSRCGWTRHTRIRASLAMTAGSPSGLNSMSFGYSDIQFTPGQNAFGGTVVTASGDLTSGIKARLWQASHDGDPMHAVTDPSDYDTVGNWVEVTNGACFTSTSETAGTCGAGLANFTTNTKFLLNATDGHTSVPNWFGSITGQTFTAVDMNTDNQF